MSDIDQDKHIDCLRAQVEARLGDLIAPSVKGGAPAPARLDASMRHSLLAPGKRVRAILAMLAASHWNVSNGGSASNPGGLDGQAALDPGCAVEMVHSASLVLDDLPAMDDSLLRRGLPANHCVYGEGTAILAAIGLMNRAFGVVAEDETLSTAQRLSIVGVLSWSIGAEGLVAGQEQDLNSLADLDSVAAIEQMHGRKTGALFAAAAEIGAIVGGAGTDIQSRAREFGWKMGVAFQTFDDLIDRYATTQDALKDTGKDDAKPTLVALLGPEQAMAAARAHLGAAADALDDPGRQSALSKFVGGLGDGLIAKLDSRFLEPVHDAS